MRSVIAAACLTALLGCSGPRAAEPGPEPTPEVASTTTTTASPEQPLLPESPPRPEELVLPPGARVAFDSALRLDRWRWPADGVVDLDWTFAFWDDPVQGTLPGRLSRGP